MVYTHVNIHIIISKNNIHRCAFRSHFGYLIDQTFSKGDPWISNTGELIEMNLIQLHPRLTESKTLRVGPAICVLTSPPGGVLKTENTCQRTLGGPRS